VKPQVAREAGRAESRSRPVHAGGLDHGGHDHRRARTVCGGSVVRAMPNTPAAIGRGITVAVPKASAPRSARSPTRCCAPPARSNGSTTRSLMDAVTAVSGSGPAYVFLLAEELARAGVAAGLPAELADQAGARDRRRLRRTAASLAARCRDLAPERHLARRHHGRGAGSADGQGRPRSADGKSRRCRDKALARTGGSPRT
jgi:hypothetical protein